MEQVDYEKLGLAKDAFRGQVVLVTGAGRGIGLEMARAFARLGAKVVLAEIADTGAALEEDIRLAGGEALFVRTDVSSETDVQHLAEKTRAYFGDVDILINNAILCPFAPLQEMSFELWQKVLSVNLNGTFLTCKAFLPGMLHKGSGRVINLVSLDAMPGLSAYITSKQGITGLTQSLYAELNQSGVQVAALSPGMVDTPGIRGVAAGLAPALGLSEAEFLNLSLHTAYEGFMPPEHAAAAAVYLASELMEEYNGEVIDGYTILEKAGLISTPDLEPVPGKIIETEYKIAVLQEAWQETQTLTKKLYEYLLKTEEEFNQLPAFARPMARSGFKKKARLRCQDWLARVDELSQTLAASLNSSEEGFNKRRSLFSSSAELLPFLGAYFHDVPRETARFTRDEEFIRQITQEMAEREKLTTDLARSLLILAGEV